MSEPGRKSENDPVQPGKTRKRAERDDPTRETGRQIDDNQDDMGRDANDPGRIANDINRTGH